MPQELKLEIIDNSNVIQKITKESDTRPAFMVKALNEFRQLVNAALTKLIEDQGDSNSCDFLQDDECDTGNDDEDIEVSPKKRKK